jgi:hypothetical protein
VLDAILTSPMVVNGIVIDRVVPDLGRVRYRLRALRDGADWSILSDGDKQVALEALEATERALELSKRLTGTWYPP